MRGQLALLLVHDAAALLLGSPLLHLGLVARSLLRTHGLQSPLRDHLADARDNLRPLLARLCALLGLYVRARARACVCAKETTQMVVTCLLYTSDAADE